MSQGPGKRVWGVTSDAAVTTDVAGTISGKLRGLVKMLASAWDSTQGRLRVNAWPPELVVNFWGTLSTGKTAHYYSILGSRHLGFVNTSALGDVCDYLDTSQSLLNTPTSGQTLYLVSTDANDTAAGTGARTVRTVYLDGTGLQQVRTDTLNGTTPVSIGTGYTAIQWMETATVGSGTVAAGAVTISSTNGAATVATTFDSITAGGNRSLSGRYYVPMDSSAYMLTWSLAAIGTTMDSRMRVDCFADDHALSTGVFHFKDHEFLPTNTLSGEMPLGFMKAPAGSVIKVSVIPGSAAANRSVDAGFHLLVVAN